MPLGSMPLLVQKVRSSAAMTASWTWSGTSDELDAGPVLLGELAEHGLAVGVVDVAGLRLEALVRVGDVGAGVGDGEEHQAEREDAVPPTMPSRLTQTPPATGPLALGLALALRLLVLPRSPVGPSPGCSPAGWAARVRALCAVRSRMCSPHVWRAGIRVRGATLRVPDAGAAPDDACSVRVTWLATRRNAPVVHRRAIYRYDTSVR